MTKYHKKEGFNIKLKKHGVLNKYYVLGEDDVIKKGDRQFFLGEDVLRNELTDEDIRWLIAVRTSYAITYPNKKANEYSHRVFFRYVK